MLELKSESRVAKTARNVALGLDAALIGKWMNGECITKKVRFMRRPIKQKREPPKERSPLKKCQRNLTQKVAGQWKEANSHHVHFY